MMGLFGRSVINSDDLQYLRETEGQFKLAKRELEDLGWTLLNAPYEQQASDIPALDRNKVIARGMEYWRADPLVGQAVDMFSDYTLGTGIPMPQSDDKKLAEVISRFWNDPENKLVLTTMESQHQKLTELQLMGNVFPVAFVNKGTGHVRFSDIPPREITDIITDPDNRKKHVFYKRQSVPTRYDFKTGSYEVLDTETKYYRSWRFQPDNKGFGPLEKDKADDDPYVFHWSINRLSDGKFGNPRIMRIIEWVRAYNEFSKARVSIMRALAKFAWNRRVKGNPGDVRRLAQAYVDGTLAGTTAPDGTFAAPPPQYAATISTNENVSWEALKTDTGGASALQDGRMIKGQIGVGYGFPLHYLGDVGGANLATATSMELPVLKMIESMQGLMESWYRDIIDFVIDCAIKAGELPALDNGRFTKERVAERLAGKVSDPGSIVEAGGSDDGDRNEYEYRLLMPPILKRQVSETVNAVVNVLKSIDPYSQNVEASRWALEFTLEVVGATNPKGIVNTVFPSGFQYPTNVEAERGRTDTLPNDGRGQVDFRKGRKPNSESRLGQKGAKEARKPGEIDTSMAESALLDVLDRALDHLDDPGDVDASAETSDTT